MDTQLSLLETLKRDGDNESWRLLSELYSPLVRRWLRRSNVRIDELDDLLQEVFLVVMDKIGSFKHEAQTGAFRNWLKKVTVNCLRNFIRKKGNKAFAMGGSGFDAFLHQCEDPQSRISQIWEEEHRRGVLAYLIKSVKPRFSAATYQAFYQTAILGKSSQEVADTLGMTRASVHTAKSRVLAEMRRMGQGLQD
ncbi:MAG: sigma-70 family RNA polymerase sigma factor [Planctomycetota bacterium]